MELPIDARRAPFKEKYIDFETPMLCHWIVLGTDVNDGTRFVTSPTDDMFVGLTESQAAQIVSLREAFVKGILDVLNKEK